MNPPQPWFERFFDGLYADVLPATFSPARTLGQARLIRRLLKLRPGERVLDVPCGQGRLTLPLAQGGLALTGVDLSPRYLARARRAARAAGLATGAGGSARFICADMRRIEFAGEFDAAFNWFGSFGYFSSAGNLAFARRVLRALRPGGRFLVEGLNRSWLKAHFRPEGDETIGGVRIEHRRNLDPRTHRVRDTWTLSRGKRREQHRISMQLYTGGEIRALLRAAGFRPVRLFGYPPLGRLSRHSRRWIAVAIRPATGG